MTHAQIAQKYGIAVYYGVTPEIAKGIVSCALTILLTEDRRRTIREATDYGKRCCSGKAGGAACYEKRLGIHEQSPEERRRVAIRGLLAMGKMPYSTEAEPTTGLSEKDYAMYLSGKPDYLHTRGRYAGRPHSAKIAAKLNEVFHSGAGIRSPQAIKWLLCDERKKLIGLQPSQ